MIRKLIMPAILWCSIPALPGFGQTDIFLPQFLNGAVGSHHWRTTLMIQNQDPSRAQVRLHFLDHDGAPMQTFMMQRHGGHGHGDPVGPNGQFHPEPVNARAMVAYRSGGQGGLRAGYVRVQSQSRVQAHARLQLFDEAGELVSETHVAPCAPFRSGSFYAERTGGAAIGLALLNPSQAFATDCTLELSAQDGTTPLATVFLTLGRSSQTSRFLWQLFGQTLADDVGFVRMTCDNPVLALALHLEGTRMMQIPVLAE